MNKSKVIDEIKRMAEECGEEGWDGYGAYPITEQHIEKAMEFVNSLPDCLETPTVGADPNGDITIEWYKDVHRIISVSVSVDGDAIFAMSICGSVKSVGDEGSENLISAIKLLFENKEQSEW